MKPELGNVGNNLVKMSDYISDIVRDQKVDLIVFPELAISGYELGMQFTELAQRVPGAAVNSAGATRCRCRRLSRLRHAD
jgi:predicted amidohydrolase